MVDISIVGYFGGEQAAPQQGDADQRIAFGFHDGNAKPLILPEDDGFIGVDTDCQVSSNHHLNFPYQRQSEILD